MRSAEPLFAYIDNDGDQDCPGDPHEPLLFVNDGKGTFAPVAARSLFYKPLEGLLTGSVDGRLRLRRLPRRLSLRLIVLLRRRRGESRHADALPRRPQLPAGRPVPQRRKGRFVDAIKATGLDAGNDRDYFAAARPDYDEDGWADLLAANDFGVKNLYRISARAAAPSASRTSPNGGRPGSCAGMSAAFLDDENDGRLDPYWQHADRARPARHRVAGVHAEEQPMCARYASTRAATG